MSSDEFIKRWTEVDTAQSADYQNYLSQISSHESIQGIKKRSFDMLNIEQGQNILDVGCGNGDDVRTIARIVGNRGSVVGIDISKAMIDGALNHPDNVELPVTFLVDDGHNLQFSDSSFDRCRIERVLQHVQDRHTVLSEIVRVTRADGWIFASDPDRGTLVADGQGEMELTNRILNYISSHIPTTGWAARESYRMFKQAGLKNVSVVPNTVIFTEFSVASRVLQLETAVAEMVQTGVLTSNEATLWITTLKDADNNGLFFSALSGFSVRGRKP